MSIPMEYSSIYRDSQTMDNLEKQLICPVCLEMFTKPVVILPCQHNLCRKCANDIFQSRGTALGSGGCFRCPSCRQEIILDRHGVYGLQRNLLVENIIDIYKQESLRSTAKPEQPTCEEHDEEKINIYCISCETPTCSLCKVFGVHKACEVAPLLTVYKQQKCKLGDGIGALVVANDTIQTFITHLEETNKNIEDNCRSQKQTMHEKFDSLFAVLESKKQDMMQIITNEQDEKICHCNSLIKIYTEHIQSISKLVESALQSMEEPQMAVFLRNAKMLTAKVSEATRTSAIEELEHGYENMDHYNIDLEKEQNLLQAIHFLKESITTPCRASMESVAASPGPTNGIFPGGESIIPFIDVETSQSAQEKADVELSETTVNQLASDKLLSENCKVDDLKMPQLLTVFEEDTKFYPGWHKCGSWHMLKSTMLATSPNPSAASHDLSGSATMSENLAQPEASSVAVAAGSSTVIETSENTVPSPVAKALGFCLSLMAMMIILLNLWNRIEFMACTWKG